MKNRVRAFWTIAVLLILQAGLPRPALAQKSDLSVEQIPEILLESAGAVIRYSFTRVEVQDPRNMTLQVRKAVTVLNSRGESEGVAYVFYDKSRKINRLKGSIYDASGKLMRTIKEKEFSDQSAISDISIYEDTRIKYYQPSLRDYPYTIVYEYEVKHTNTHYFQDWFPVRSSLVAVQNAVYEVVCSKGFQIRVKEMNLPRGQTEAVENGAVVHRWELHDLPAFGDEPFAPPPRSFVPHVVVAPVAFEYEGKKGSFSNWEQYGKWVYEQLLAERDEVPEATAARIRKLVSDARDDREKVERIYRYVQEKNRYVSIQVGIGGLQPMLAEEVDRLSYGDCKALVNYTKALLSVAGIPSVYTEVSAGEEQRSYFRDFASFLQGNHVILCVPLSRDTVWLECTSRESPFDFLGTFTSNRRVLLITPEGGRITRTPPVKNSSRQRKAVFTLDDNGEAAVVVETGFTGAFYNDRYELDHASPREADEMLKQLYPLNSMYVEDWTLTHQKEGRPLTTEKLRLKVRDFTSLSSGRLFLPLNPLNRIEDVPGRTEERKSDVFIRESYVEKDTFEFRLPKPYPAEYLPEKVLITKPFGQYSLSVTINDSLLVCERELRLKSGTYPPETYEDLIRFFRDAQRADYQKAVFKTVADTGAPQENR